MKTGIFVILLFLLYLNSDLKAQTIIGRRYFGKSGCTKILKRYMIDSLFEVTKDRKIPRKQRKIRTKNDAIKLIEPLFFKEYGEEDIKDEKPYEVHLIHGFWFVKGTLKRSSVGGTALGLIDSKSGEVVFIFHSK